MMILERIAAFAVGVMIPILASCFILMTVSGCGPSRGWSFNIGVHPVSEVDDHKLLRYEESDYGENTKVAKNR